jgi:hypothetical protein
LTPDVGFPKVLLLFWLQMFVFLRFHCYVGSRCWFSSGFIAILVSDVNFLKGILLFDSQTPRYYLKSDSLKRESFKSILRASLLKGSLLRQSLFRESLESLLRDP